jgi:hypothetical protein
MAALSKGANCALKLYAGIRNHEQVFPGKCSVVGGAFLAGTADDGIAYATENPSQ